MIQLELFISKKVKDIQEEMNTWLKNNSTCRISSIEVTPSVRLDGYSSGGTSINSSMFYFGIIKYTK